MKLTLILVVALIATASDYRIVDLKPNESQELAALDSKVSATEQALKDARSALDKKRFAVCIAHGIEKKVCDRWSVGGSFGPSLSSSGTTWTSSGEISTGGSIYASTCVGWDRDFKHLVIEK